jgi:hypothetical protein
MARQDSESGSTPDFGAWIDRWWAELCSAPYQVSVELDEPLQEKSGVLLTVGPHVELRDRMGCRELSRYRDGYEVPICVLAEVLSADTGQRLVTALTVIRNLQGLNFREALACLFFLALINHEWVATKQGKSPLLGRDTWGSLKIPESDRTAFVEERLREPEIDVETLLYFWDRIGARMAHGFRPEKDELGHPTYFVIPPVWLSMDVVRRLGKEYSEVEVPVLVTASIAPVVQGFAAMYEAHLQRGEPLDIGFRSRKETAAAEEVEKVAHRFQREGEVWRVTYDGKELPPIPDNLGGYACIHFLLERVRKPLSIFDVLGVLDRAGGTHRPGGIQSAKSTEGEGSDEKAAGQVFGGAIPASDLQALKAIRKQRARLLEDEAQAEAEGALDRRDELRAERERLEEYAKASFSASGRSRQEPPELNRARARLNGLLNRACKQLGGQCPELESHLRRYIRQGALCSYEPDRDITWLL